MGATLRTRVVDAGHSRARFILRRLGEELRVARVAAGLSQEQLARRAGVSQPAVSKVERGVSPVSFDVACRLAAAAGCELGVRIHPAEGVGLRDSGQMGMAESIVAAASPRWQARLEQSVSDSDRRAADLVLRGPDEVIHIEIERRLVDFQAQLRSATLKRDALAARYQIPVRLVLTLPDRQWNRDIVKRFATLLSRTLPVPSARIRRAFVSGEPIGGDGILFWPVRRTHGP